MRTQTITTEQAIDPVDTATLDALCADVHELVQERLMPCDAQWVALAVRTAAEGDVGKAARVLANTLKNVRRANGTDTVHPSGPATSRDSEGDAKRNLAAALDAGIAAGQEVTAEARAQFGEVVGRLVSGLAEIERLATQVDDDCQHRLDVVALLAKGLQSAPQDLLDWSGYAAADAAGDVESAERRTGVAA